MQPWAPAEARGGCLQSITTMILRIEIQVFWGTQQLKRAIGSQRMQRSTKPCPYIAMHEISELHFDHSNNYERYFPCMLPGVWTCFPIFCLHKKH